MGALLLFGSPMLRQWGDFYDRWLSSANVTETAEGLLLITSAPGRYAGWAAVFLVMMPLMRWLRRRGIGCPFSTGFFWASFMIPLIILPMLALESVLISPQRIEYKTGFWFAPTVSEINLAGLKEIQQEDPALNLTQHGYQELRWVLHYRSGKTHRWDPPDLFEGNRAEIRHYLSERGIRFGNFAGEVP